VDEAAGHTPENVAAFRATVESGWPGAGITWALSWCALRDRRKNYEAIRDLVSGFHSRHGDEVTFIPGGYFANAYNTREQVNRDPRDGLAMVSRIVGRGYRPRAVIAGFLAAANLRYLAEHEGIHVCQGNIWSQYAVDNQDGDGSICYPYYPSREHFCKPAARRADFIDCVNLDGWTMDFLAARRPGFAHGFNSRMGVGPIETIRAPGPEKGLRQMMDTAAVHFDGGFELNRFAWVTNIWEICLTRGVPRKTRLDRPGEPRGVAARDQEALAANPMPHPRRVRLPVAHLQHHDFGSSFGSIAYSFTNTVVTRFPSARSELERCSA
jgi:hypothetical protein